MATKKIYLLFSLFSVLPATVFAQGISGNSAGEFVSSFYTFALAIAGALAFGAIVYGGIKYTFAAGNPSGQSEGKDWVKSALLGLLLLAAAGLVLRTINPKILNLTVEGLPALPTSSGGGQPSGGSGGPAPTSTTGYGCTQTAGTQGVCANYGCTESPALVAARSCAQSLGTITATTGGGHVCNLSASTPSISCHFGGRSCKDGGHAFDLAALSGGKTWSQGKAAASACTNVSACYCEGRDSNNNIFRDDSCTDPRINHLHCNIGSCGCN